MAKPRKRININHLRKVLYQKYKKRFNIKNWDDTLFPARQISETLLNYKLSQSRVNIAKAVSIIKPSKRKKRDKQPDPLVPEEYLVPKSFWSTDDIINLIKISDKKIWFTSKYIFNQGKSLQVEGGTSIDYDTYLSNWAKACSKLQHIYKNYGGDTYAPYWRIQEQPKLIKGKFYAEIIECDQNGQETEFTSDTFKEKEFIPKPEPEKPTQPITPTPAVKLPELPPIEKSKLKKQELDTLRAYRDSIKDDIEFQSKYKRDVTSLWEKYDNVSKQIDDLMKKP